MELRANDSDSWLETVWDALHAYRADLIPEGDEQYDEIWSDICTAMAWISETVENEWMYKMENLTAKVAQPNTSETDRMLDVNHIVSWTENNIQKSMTVLARDPMEAIRLIQRLYKAHLKESL
ncbi:hypothetical protein OAA20_00530 [bacterium]|nr:hypothetical protein [bacterium]